MFKSVTEHKTLNFLRWAKWHLLQFFSSHTSALVPVKGEHDQSVTRDSQSADDEDEEGDDVMHMIRDVQSFVYQPLGLHHQTEHLDTPTKAEEQHFNKASVSADSVMVSVFCFLHHFFSVCHAHFSYTISNSNTRTHSDLLVGAV